MRTTPVGTRIGVGTRPDTAATASDGQRSTHVLQPYKGGVLYTKPSAQARFLTALEHKPTRETARTHAAETLKQWAGRVDAEWGEDTAARIGLVCDTRGGEAAA